MICLWLMKVEEEGGGRELGRWVEISVQTCPHLFLEMSVSYLTEKADLLLGWDLTVSCKVLLSQDAWEEGQKYARICLLF